MKKLILLSMLGFSIISANAALYLYEDFTPATGITPNAMPATAPYPGTPKVQTSNLSSTYTWSTSGATGTAPALYLGDLSYPGLQTNSSSNCKAEVGSKVQNGSNSNGMTAASNIALTTGTNVPVYFSFLFSVGDLDNITALFYEQPFFHAYSSSGSNTFGISATADQILASEFSLSFRGLTNGAATWTSGNLSINTTYLIVFGTEDMRGASGTSAMSIWLNPVVNGSYQTPTSTTALWRRVADANTLNVRIGNVNALDYILPTIYVDEVRVGSDFLSVVPAIPEPASLALLALGAIALVLRRRRN